MTASKAPLTSWSVLNAQKKIGPLLGSSIRPNLVLIRLWLRSWSELSEVPEKSLCARTDCNFVSFPYINVSQGIVATQFRCGEIINNRFIANFPKSVTVKELLKSVKTWRRYGKKYGGMFFDSL